MNEYALEVIDLTKTFGKDVKALDKVSFKIKKGEITGYIGPNGSGKTTTIKTMTNLISPTSGRILIDGIDPRVDPKTAMNRIGCLIEVPGVYDYLTPKDLLLYMGQVRRMDPKYLKDRIEVVLELVKLSAWKDKRVKKFSTGMQRRLMIANAILHEPDILILDEPVIGLDPDGIRDIRLLIKKLNDQGITVLVSSHLLQELYETCTDFIFIKKGQIIAHKNRKELQEAMGKKKVMVRTLEKVPKEVLPGLTEVKGVTGIDHHNGDLIINTDGSSATNSRLLKKMMSLDIPVTSFAPREGNIEEYYGKLMEGGEAG